MVVLLYVGREIFIPIVIAILVSFVLSPPILLLRRWGLGRIISVLTVVFAALVIAFSVSAVLTRQVSELASDLPLYQATINAKLDDLRGAAADNVVFCKSLGRAEKLRRNQSASAGTFERARSFGPTKEPTRQGSGKRAPDSGRGSPA